ncbi:uncharacterized protein LOC129962112 isoform X3 [Argiope bruennichi]|uniref:uncharacterized protein LOC129962112 isoform X3 n=1 Tax=Argiope bruennichi TaxID=94029 RepID=UPI0024944BA9|nr:uncharacterized protein LOC129962112 isoform X3 [Argiope bruennichi]
MFCQVKMQRILKSFLLCIWIFPPQYSDAVDEDSVWRFDSDLKKDVKKQDSDLGSFDFAEFALFPLLKYLGIIIAIITAISVLWKLLLAFCGSGTESSTSRQTTSKPSGGRNEMNENQNTSFFDSPNHREATINFDNPLDPMDLLESSELSTVFESTSISNVSSSL